MTIQKIYVGGWFQRTTLHLSELHDFLRYANSPLDLDKDELKTLQQSLELDDVSMQVDDLEYVLTRNRNGVSVKLYEDGLIVLSSNAVDGTAHTIGALTSYYEDRLSKAISYLFSLGAPVPKELANIKTIYPYFVVLEKATPNDIRKLLEQFEQDKSFEIKEKTFEIYRGDKLYIVNNKGEALTNIEKFIQEQIFMREFKAQMHRYLNIHRIIWEKIADVKEKGKIRGRDIEEFRGRVESYAKTINLIGARIDQMGTYVGTRASIVKSSPELKPFLEVMEFKHETLSNTLSYVKDIWGMTKNYVDSALTLFSDLQAQSTDTSVQNLTVVTSVGVAGTLIGLFTQDSIPSFTVFGFAYFAILVLIGYSANRIMKEIARRRSYEISDTEIDTRIK